ncbi:MAG TPA: SDR family oxidoreductase [Steroidobacteraceae bacterium]|jgi:uncharacterized protein YbjT (DUF2867 family)
MKIVVIGGSGLIGSKLVDKLRALGHEVLAASPNSGVNTLTGEGLPEALAGAQVVVDVANSPSFEDAAVLNFFETAGRNLLAAEARAGVRHHIALSVVGTGRKRLLESGYIRAKLAQENLIKAASIPYSILRSTQFFEFIGRIAQESADGKGVRVSNALFQPIVSDDVVAALTDLAVGSPVNGIVEVAGPDKLRLDDLVRQALRANGDTREVTTDASTRYFGAELDDQTLTPDAGARIGTTHFADWISRSKSSKPAAAATAKDPLSPRL